MLWVLFTFPSRYLCAIGLGRVFSLGGWARRIHTGFHVPRATQDTAMLQRAADKGLSPSAARLSRRFSSPASCNGAVLQPRRNRNPCGLGYSPVARHYWGNHVLFSSPRGTKMFQFPRLASSVKGGWQPSRLPGCPIQEPPDQGPLASPRSFSQLAAPFIAFPSHRHPPCALSCFRMPRKMRGAYLGIARLRRTEPAPVKNLPSFLFCSRMSMNGRPK